MGFSFEDHSYNKLLNKAGISDKGIKGRFAMLLIPFSICWLPLAVMTIINGTFWTGDVTTSFITNFDTQVRFLITMPIFILSEKLIRSKLGIILNQFINSGIIIKEEKVQFESIINKQSDFLKSKNRLHLLFS